MASETDAADHARKLVDQHGPPEAWQIANAAAIDAHLAHDPDRRDYWRAVQAELSRTAPRPGPGNLDIYRTAHLLIASKGVSEAAGHALQRGAEVKGDLVVQAVWARVHEAIVALARTEPRPSEWTQ